MCEIFFVVKPGGTLSTRELRKFLEACYPAYVYNDDGWGAMWESGFVKSPETFVQGDIESIISRYRKSRFFAFHVRKATSPVNYRNTHPFTVDDFRGIHNGVVDVKGYNEGVDSLELFHKIRDTPGNGLPAKIAGALKRGVSGTYSVLIHSFSAQKLYYFKNHPSFGFMLSETPEPMVYGATQISRLEGLAPLSFGVFASLKTATPQPSEIYEIDLNTAFIKPVGTIKEEYVPPKYSRKCTEITYFDDETQTNKPIGKAIDYRNLAPRRGWKDWGYGKW